jgi:hypothetical protein
MKLTVEIGRGLVTDGPGEYWADYLCVTNAKGGFIWSDYACFDVDYTGDGTRLPTEAEIRAFIKKVQTKYPGAIVEDGTGVL